MLPDTIGFSAEAYAEEYDHTTVNGPNGPAVISTDKGEFTVTHDGVTVMHKGESLAKVALIAQALVA